MHKQTEAYHKNRKEIKISLVEGMVYDDTGRDMTLDKSGNAKFLELNFRKRPLNELQSERNYDDSFRTYRYKNYSFENEEGSESDYVAKFIEQTAALSGIDTSKKYQELSPVRKRFNDK